MTKDNECLLASSLSPAHRMSRKIDRTFFPGAGSDGLRVPVAGLTRVDTIQGKKDRDNRQMAFGQACELTGEEYTKRPFFFLKSNRRVPYRLDLLMEQVRLTVSSCQLTRSCTVPVGLNPTPKAEWSTEFMKG